MLRSSNGTMVTRTLKVMPEERKKIWSEAALNQRFRA
jgi:hypothetical protein